MKTNVMKAAALGSVSAALAADAVPTVHMPLHMRYGYNNKVSTELVLPYGNQTIEVCYDLGSPDFWVFAPDSIQNWGCHYLACQGHCNRTVPDSGTYDASLSPTASEVEPWTAMYGYGGGLAKMYNTKGIVNDTFSFTSADGRYSTKVPNVQVALVDYLQQRINDEGSCSPVPPYDFSILGLAPYVSSPDPLVQNTTGPSFRQNLLEQGQISAPVQSLWFEKAPDGVMDTYTGSGLLGGLDTSKYEGPLVKIPRLYGAYSENEYYTYAANITVNGTEVEIDRSGTKVGEKCLIDSGAVADSVLPVDKEAFLQLTGLRENPTPNRRVPYLSWPDKCDTIPADRFIDYSFTGVDASEKVTVKVPMRAYARYQEADDEAMGWCTMALYANGCGLSAPFFTAVYFAADDERGEIAFAQGGVAEQGSGVDPDSVVLRIP